MNGPNSLLCAPSAGPEAAAVRSNMNAVTRFLAGASLAAIWFVALPACGDNGHGESQGLVAHYFHDPSFWAGNWPDDVSAPSVSPAAWTFSQYAYSRKEPLINHQFVRHGWFTVSWRGLLDTSPGHPGKGGGGEVPHDYTFELWADDGCRLYIDGRAVIDSWKPCSEDSPEAHRRASVRLADGKHRIRVDYFQGQSLAREDRDPVKLYWNSYSRGIPRQIVPASHFSHTADDLVPPNRRK